MNHLSLPASRALLAPAEQGYAVWEILVFAKDYCNISVWSVF